MTFLDPRNPQHVHLLRQLLHLVQRLDAERARRVEEGLSDLQFDGSRLRSDRRRRRGRGRSAYRSRVGFLR